MSDRRAELHLPVPGHLERYLRECEGCWTLFDARYVTHPEHMPATYTAETATIERYAVSRLTPANVRAAILSFCPREPAPGTKRISDRQCHHWAMGVLDRANEDLRRCHRPAC